MAHASWINSTRGGQIVGWLLALFSLLSQGAATPAHGQEAGAVPIARAETPDALRWILASQARVGERSIVTAGGIYLGGLGLGGPFVSVDRSISRHWGVHAGYYYLVRSVPGNPDLTSQFMRLGLTYRKSFGSITVDNRLLYEAVINNRDRDNANRLRNRARITYDVSSRPDLEPRLFAYIEPIYDDRFDRIARTDLAVGAGATIARAWRTDIYLLKQDNRGAARADARALVVQLTLDLSALRGHSLR